MKVAQLCLTLCDPMDCSPPDPLCMEFSRQENWSGLPFPSPDLSNPGIEPGSPTLQVDSLPSEPPGKFVTRRFYWACAWSPRLWLILLLAQVRVWPCKPPPHLFSWPWKCFMCLTKDRRRLKTQEHGFLWGQHRRPEILEGLLTARSLGDSGTAVRKPSYLLWLLVLQSEENAQWASWQEMERCRPPMVQGCPRGSWATITQGALFLKVYVVPLGEQQKSILILQFYRWEWHVPRNNYFRYRKWNKMEKIKGILPWRHLSPAHRYGHVTPALHEYTRTMSNTTIGQHCLERSNAKMTFWDRLQKSHGSWSRAYIWI